MELLRCGVLVQLQHADSSKNLAQRNPLRALKNEFLVCIGVNNPNPDPVPSSGRSSHGSHYLEEPVIIEPRFREQFMVANPTPGYASTMEVPTFCIVRTTSVLVCAFLCFIIPSSFTFVFDSFM